MRDEQEYAFSHLLVRDVCYAQIPRAGRAARHRAAARWLERRSGDRLEDLADVLAHHYLSALNLAQVAGQQAELPELQDGALRYLALAGERALALDPARAEASIRRALDIAADEHPDRARLLERWAQTLLPLARGSEAQAALEEALTRYEAQGDVVGAGRALMAVSVVLWVLGKPAREPALQAVSILEAHPGPELVNAYTELAGEFFVSGEHQAASDAARHALQLADELALPAPAKALGFLGGAKALGGDRAGLADSRQALAQAIERNPGRDAAVIYANLAVATSVFDGPRAALEVCEEAKSFCAARGVPAMHLFMRAVAARALAQSGAVDEALVEAQEVFGEASTAGDVPVSLMARSLAHELRAQRGEAAQVDLSAETVVFESQKAPTPYMLLVIGSVQLDVALGRVGEARQGLLRIAEASVSGEALFAQVLPDLVRCALAIGDRGLARQLTTGIEMTTPCLEHAMVTVRALLAEADQELDQAAAGLADAAARWLEFGNVPERAYALLGQGRCQLALHQPQASEVLTEAGLLFASLGFRPALAEVRALLGDGYHAP
jgi:tetratricopeptide (TPR) repeat protein